jgi:molybdopterin-dependent oxidoreductase alpha subunit
VLIMAEIQPDIAGAEAPDRFTGLKLGRRKETAAGIPAVLSSFRHVFGEAGLARGWKALTALNQKGGFDCPSCAWPDPDDERSGIAEYCENGAKAVAEEATARKLDAAFFAKNSVADLGTLTDYEIGRKGRIAQPMYLPRGATHYQPISWDNAFRRIGEHLNRLRSPDEAVFYTSGRTSNEAAFLYQLFVREYGTNNLPDCSNMCHESSGVALSESLGIGKGSVTLEDFYKAEVIIILGQNPGTNHPRMLTALQKAKAHGAIIVSINPLPETGLMGFDNPQTVKGVLHIDSALTDLFLQVRINADMPLLQAVQHVLLRAAETEDGILDSDFIENNTSGFEQLKAHILAKDPERLARESGIDIAQIYQLAELLKHRNKIIACWAMGLTQHKNAVATIREVVNLLLLKGSVGKPGAGTCPVRGHSNVQGDRTVGIYEKPSQSFLDSIEANFGFAPPREHGYDTVEAIHAMHEGKAKVFFAMGGNFLSATPDTQYTAAALQKCDLTVHVSTKLNRSHVIHGKEAIILPTLGRSDRDLQNGVAQFVSCENSMGVIQSSEGILKPVSDELLSEPVIVCRLAKATLGGRSKVDWETYGANYDHIRDAIEQTIPGFDDYNSRVRKPGGFYLPNGSRVGNFKTREEKAVFHVADYDAVPVPDGAFLMMTIRSHDQFNTTIYGLDDRYRGVYNERRVVFMNHGDIRNAGFKPGEVVDLVNDEDGRERIATRFIIVPFAIPTGCIATYFPETNVLVPIRQVADKSNTPVSKSIVVQLRGYSNE